jgi:cobalt transporter subunit CbtA
MSLALLVGAISGLLLFVVQHFTVFPMIEKAEVYESRAEQAMPGMHHEEEAWHPADGVERTLYTAATTVITGVGFAALFFGVIALRPVALNWRKGALWGVAAFVCVELAPSLGLPPQPPGVAVADIYARQLWWVAAVASAAVGLWLLFDSRKSWLVRSLGVAVLALPHLIGAPIAVGENSVPAQLIHQFALASILTMAIFWITLGSLGGLFYKRSWFAEQQ